MRSAPVALLILFFAAAASAAPLEREMAITFDDLPAVPATMSIARQRQLTRDLLRSIRTAGVPAIGFVNEDKLATPAHAGLLRSWLAEGLELGNHTYSHPDLHSTDIGRYEEEILRGESVTRALLAQSGRAPRWFRHPYLHTGTSLETRRRIEAFLGDHGYRVAPVTLDNSEWIFARAYELAGDRAMRKRIGKAYLEYLDRKVAYYEDQSQKLFGRNIRHVLLLHANALNAAWFDDLAAMLTTRGYRFITLERALEDPAYRSPDTYAGKAGISWIHRWAITAGKKSPFFDGEPATPEWIQDYARIRE